MKRSSPLRGKVTIRSKTGLSALGILKAISDKRKEKMEKYNHLKAMDADQFRECPVCKVTSNVNIMQPHHPAGRLGDNLYKFIWVCPGCHVHIHENERRAIENGWMEDK